MARLRKKEAYDLYRELEIETLREISQVSKYVNFQRGSKTAIRNAIRQATTQEEVNAIASYINELRDYQEMGISGMVEMYLNTDSFRIAKYYGDEYGLSNKKMLQFFEQYETTLHAIDNSDQIEKLIQEFILEDFELGVLEESEYDV